MSENQLDDAVMAYLGRKSCTPYYMIASHFELHDSEMIAASIDRLTARGRVTWDARRQGFCTSVPPLQEVTSARSEK